MKKRAHHVFSPGPSLFTNIAFTNLKIQLLSFILTDKEFILIVDILNLKLKIYIKYKTRNNRVLISLIFFKADMMSTE